MKSRSKYPPHAESIQPVTADALIQKWTRAADDERNNARKLTNAGNHYAAGWHRDMARVYDECVNDLRRALRDEKPAAETPEALRESL